MDLRQPGMHAQAMVPPSARRVIQGTIKTGRRVAHARAVARVSTKQVDAREPKIQLAVRAQAAPRGSTKQADAREPKIQLAVRAPAAPRGSTKQADAREPKIQLAVRARAAPRGSTKQATAQEARTRYATQMPAHAQEAPVLRVLYVPIMAT